MASVREGISRRNLLIGGGAGIGLVLAWALWPRDYRPNLRAGPDETVFNAFLKIGRDGRVIVAVPQTELGQGVYTSLPQILADELGADWRTVAVEPAPVSPLYANLLLAEQAAAGSAFPSLFGIDRWSARQYARGNAVMLTAGSSSVRHFEGFLREAGAAARALLSLAAAQRWNVDWQILEARDGFIWHEANRLPFGELAEAAAGLTPPSSLPIRGGVDDRLAGQPLPRLDLPAKIDGSAMFAGDVRIPDMVFAALRSAPPGSSRVSLDRAAAEAVPGALQVVEHDDFVAVVGSNWWAAAKGLERLRPRYRLAPGPSAEAVHEALVAALETGTADTLFERGDIDAEFAGASPVTARYSLGLAPTAVLEPLTATARWQGDRLEIWAPSQAPGLARAAAARAAGCAESQVTFYPALAGGGYGRKLETAAIEQAAFLATRVERPVQLSWPRIQEIQRDTFRPAAAAQMSAWISPRGISAWRARIAAPDTSAEVARRLRAAESFFRPDGGTGAGAMPPYAIANVAIEHVLVDLGLATGIDRGGAHAAGCFFTESFVDELSRAAGIEPLSFRMRMLADNPRLARALTQAASIGGWDGGPPGSGMGLAAHSAFGSHIAALVEIELGRDRRARVLRAVCAVDCGRIVNPEIVKQQVEGGFLHGLAAALSPPIAFARGLPSARTLGAYRLPVLRNAPDVTVELIDSEEEPGGITELAVPVAAPAIANALFSLAGRRLRALPLMLDR
ncbi:MAG: molybdopterin cofactor-binding domain-containing protein [Sphingosinicella sp.]